MRLANAKEVERTLGWVGDRPATRHSYSGSGVQPFRWLLNLCKRQQETSSKFLCSSNPVLRRLEDWSRCLVAA